VSVVLPGAPGNVLGDVDHVAAVQEFLEELPKRFELPVEFWMSGYRCVPPRLECVTANVSADQSKSLSSRRDTSPLRNP
jgi:hypothetical protein